MLWPSSRSITGRTHEKLKPSEGRRRWLFTLCLIQCGTRPDRIFTRDYINTRLHAYGAKLCADICPRTLSVPRSELRAVRGTRNVPGHLICSCQGKISEHSFVPNGHFCVYYSSNLFRNAPSFENCGIICFGWRIVSHVTCLDQSYEPNFRRDYDIAPSLHPAPFRVIVSFRKT